jgi:hypothetical protein
MPHQCTNCGKVFEDGSKEMLSGCPNCGGNKFQFRPAGSRETTDAQERGDTVTPEQSSRETSDRQRSPDDTGSPDSAPDSRATRGDADANAPDDRRQSESRTADASPGEDAGSSGVRSRVSDWFRSGPDDVDESPSDSGRRPAHTRDAPDESREDTAQASARSDVVSRDELAAAANEVPSEERQGPDGDGAVIEPDTDERPDLEELRAELNQQFESIKIVSPGQYELNLMELYDREEYIISLREDGRYVIEVPDTWRDDGE